MIPPKYNFYIGKLYNSYISENLTIDNAGEYQNESDKYVYASRNALEKNDLIFVNLIFNSEYNAIFFYDRDNTMVGKVSLKGQYIITPPSTAAYWSIRFIASDPDFNSKKGTQFVYLVNLAHPHYKELSKKYEKEKGQEFFRVSLDGKIKFFGSDFEKIADSSLEDSLIFLITKFAEESESYYEYYKGSFNKTDCKLDYAKKSCELKTNPLDAYTEVINKLENTYDLLKLAPAISKIKMYKRSMIQVYVRGYNTISNFFGGTFWESDVLDTVDSHDKLLHTYFFSLVKTCTEFFIENAEDERINGVYASQKSPWTNNNGAVVQFTKLYSKGDLFSISDDTPSFTVYSPFYKGSRNAQFYNNGAAWLFVEDIYELQIVLAGEIKYKSKYLFTFGAMPKDIPEASASNIYLDRDDIELISTSDSTSTITLQNVFAYHIYCRLLCDVASIEDSEGTKATYDLPNEDFVIDNRNYKKCIGLQGILVFNTSRTSKEPTRYGQNDYGEYFTDNFISTVGGFGRALPVCRSSWGNSSLWFIYDYNYPSFEKKLQKSYDLKDSYSIASAIKVLLLKINPTLSHEATPEYSQFLYGETMPLNGIARFYVYLTQKTNILKGEYDRPAQKAETSLDSITKMLRDCFRCYWYIDNGKFKIEHIYFFMNGGSYTSSPSTQLDLTNLADVYNKKPISFYQEEIEFEKSELNQRYEFNWMDDVTDSFGNTSLDILSNYIQKDKSEEISIQQFSSDIDYMLLEPTNFANDGFALLCPISKKTSQFGCYKTSVYPGQRITIYTKGAVNARAYAVTDINRVILQVADANISTLDEPAVIDITSHGFLYINCTPSNNDKFKLIIGYETFDNTILTPGAYYHLSGGLGSIAPLNTSGYGYSTHLELPIIQTELIDESKRKYDIIAQNWYASWNYLIKLYLYDMPAKKIESNHLGELTAFDIKRCMEHSVEFQANEDLDVLKLIKTNLGQGKIVSYSVNLNTRQVKAKLAYIPR